MSCREGRITKRVVCVFLCMTLLLAGCGGVETATPEGQQTVEAVLVDDGVMKVSFIEIFETGGFCYLRLQVENKIDQQVSVYLMDAYVNDTAVTMMSGVPMDIAPGKTSQNPFIFSGFTANEVKKIEFKVHVYDESMNTIEETGTVKIEKG